MYKYLYGKPNPDPPVCEGCGRVTSNNDPELAHKDSIVIACGSCSDKSDFRIWAPSAEKQTTMRAAKRYCVIFVDSYIVGDGIDSSAWLYRKDDNVHRVVAEIPPII